MTGKFTSFLQKGAVAISGMSLLVLPLFMGGLFGGYNRGDMDDSNVIVRLLELRGLNNILGSGDGGYDTDDINTYNNGYNNDGDHDTDDMGNMNFHFSGEGVLGYGNNMYL
jgi:hypothetical protein